MATKTFNTTLNDELVPVEDFIYTGLEKQWSSVFGGVAAIVQSTDKKKVLQERMGGELQYPYTSFTITSIAEVEGRGNQKFAALHGTPVALSRDGSTFKRVGFLPVEVTLNAELVTNNFQQLSRLVNTWMFARIKGTLHFNVNYGRTAFSIRVQPSGTLSLPERQADNDTPQEYILTAEVALHSYISDILSVQADIVQEVEMDVALASEPGTNLRGDVQFWKFEKNR